MRSFHWCQTFRLKSSQNWRPNPGSRAARRAVLALLTVRLTGDAGAPWPGSPRAVTNESAESSVPSSAFW